MDGEYKEKYKEKLELRDLSLAKDNSFIKIECPSCQDHVSASEININDKIAKCGSCDVVFSFANEIVDIIPEAPKEGIARPEGVEIMYYKDELELILDQPQAMWNILIASIMPFVAIFAFLVHYVKDKGGFVVGIVATLLSIYSIVTMIIARKRNKIFVSVDDKKIKIEYRPKNLKKDKLYDVEDIEQLYVAATPEGCGLFMVYNSVNGQKHQQIIGRISNVIRAKYLEQEIEKHLGLPNKKITGEL